MKCRCCGLYIENKNLLKKLEKLRDKVGVPIRINSSTRCLHHNTMVHGSGTSSHLRGKAADISCGDMFKLRKYAYQIFNRMGLAPDYIHVDVDEDKPQDTDWFYTV